MAKRIEEMRLIDADEVKLPKGFFEKVDNVPKFYEWLDTLPTVDTEPVRHGHWVIERGETVMHCNSCGWAFVYYGGLEEEWNYCPHCGAKMDEVKDGKED